MKWSDLSISKILDYLVNKLPIIDWFDNHKTEIGGFIAGLGGVFIGASTLLPQYSEALNQVAELLFKIAAGFGATGALGKLAKHGVRKAELRKAGIDPLTGAPKLAC